MSASGNLPAMINGNPSTYSPRVDFNTSAIGFGMMQYQGYPPPYLGMPPMGMGMGLGPLPYDIYQPSYYGNQAPPVRRRSSIASAFLKVATFVGAAVLLWKGGKGIGKLLRKKKA